MCLGVPGEIVETFDADGLSMAKVKFGGIVREACLQLVPEARVGDFVVVHVGFAISRLDAEEAARAYRLLEALGQLDELTSAAAGGALSEKAR